MDRTRPARPSVARTSLPQLPDSDGLWRARALSGPSTGYPDQRRGLDSDHDAGRTPCCRSGRLGSARWSDHRNRRRLGSSPAARWSDASRLPCATSASEPQTRRCIRFRVTEVAVLPMRRGRIQGSSSPSIYYNDDIICFCLRDQFQCSPLIQRRCLGSMSLKEVAGERIKGEGRGRRGGARAMRDLYPTTIRPLSPVRASESMTPRVINLQRMTTTATSACIRVRYKIIPAICHCQRA
jgi:hypothetical protein